MPRWCKKVCRYELSFCLSLCFLLLHYPLNFACQLFHHCRVKPGKLLPHLHVLFFEAFDDLENQVILVIQVLHDVADFFFAFTVRDAVGLCGQAVLGSLSVLAHHNHLVESH